MSKRLSAVKVLARLEENPSGFLRRVFDDHLVTAPMLHKATGLPASTCRAFLNGNRDNPTTEQFRKLLTVALDYAKVKR